MRRGHIALFDEKGLISAGFGNQDCHCGCLGAIDVGTSIRQARVSQVLAVQRIETGRFHEECYYQVLELSRARFAADCRLQYGIAYPCVSALIPRTVFSMNGLWRMQT